MESNPKTKRTISIAKPYNYKRGEVPEWSNGAVSKIAVGSEPTGGSNPSLAVGEEDELYCKRTKAHL